MPTTNTERHKPLGRKAYGSIPHLPGSRKGPGDHDIGEGPALICTEKVRNKWDLIIVQEKLDGSCCSVARLDDGQIVALGRAGYLAESSPYEQHRLFAEWVREESDRFDGLLGPGERAVGEWLAQAHGTIYDLPWFSRLRRYGPFVIFDIMRGDKRACYHEVLARCSALEFDTPNTLHIGGPLSVKNALELLGEHGAYGASPSAEGVVYRVEYRLGVKHPRAVDFLAKWVRPDKIDGLYLPEFRDEDHLPSAKVRALNDLYGDEPVWNWRP
jgi:hypothetical protein